jgi:hypothetical protein
VSLRAEEDVAIVLGAVLAVLSPAICRLMRADQAGSTDRDREDMH